MVDIDRIDDTIWFVDYTGEAADEFASNAENAGAPYILPKDRGENSQIE